MRLRTVAALASLCLSTGISRAENVNLNEKPDTALVYLTPYAVGPGVGTLLAVNHTLQQQSDAFLKVSLAQTWRLQEHWDMGLDLDWWAPGTNLGGLVNVDYVFGGNGFRPFVGLGAGVQYVDDPAYNNFGKRLGIEGAAFVGMYIDVTDDTHLRVRVPLQVVGDSKTDVAAGLDVALLFSLPTFGHPVKALKY